MNSHKQVFLHIGTPKTGTTYLQHCLLQYRDFLSKKGILVPNAGSACFLGAGPIKNELDASMFHHPLAWKLQTGRLNEFSKEMQSRMSNFEIDFESEFLNSDYEYALLSSECLYWETRRGDRIRQLRDLFPECRTTVLVTVRNPASFLDSMYSHAIYDPGYAGEAKDYFTENEAVIDLDRALAQWADAFGKENLRIIDYEALGGANIFKVLMDTCDLGSAVEGLPLPEGRANLGAGALATLIAKHMIQHAFVTQDELGAFLDCAKRYAGTSGRAHRMVSDDALNLLQATLERQPRLVIKEQMRQNWLSALGRYRARPPIENAALADVLPGLCAILQQVFHASRSDGSHDSRGKLSL